MAARLATARALAAAEPAPAATFTPTKDRLSEAARQALVKAPLEEMLGGHVAEGAADFEDLLTKRGGGRGDHSLAIGDTLSAMGVGLYTGATDAGLEDLRRKSLTYLARAVPALKAAFGEGHPEVALALTDYVTAALQIDPENPAPEVEAAAEEAYRIRLAALGAKNVETVEALATLGQIRGLESRVKGDPARVAAAAAMVSQAARLGAAIPRFRPVEYGRLYLTLARIYVVNGQIDRAMEAFALAEAAFQSPNPQESAVRGVFLIETLTLATDMEAKGFKAQATLLRERYSKEMGGLIAGLSAQPPAASASPK